MNEFNVSTCKAGNAIAEFIHFAEEKDYNIATRERHLELPAEWSCLFRKFPTAPDLYFPTDLATLRQ
jgi:hypothetical protein